jgi:hypothetical protein
LFFVSPRTLWAGEVYVSHGLRLFEDDNFFSQWQDLNDQQRVARAEAILDWLKWVKLFGSTLIVDAPDTSLAAFDRILPDPDKPVLAKTVDLDQMVGLFNSSGMNIVLEIRPTSGELVPPDSLTNFVKRVRSLVERYDGDLDFGIDTPFATDELPYPDINQSWVVSSADFDGTSDAEKQAFADGHRVAAYSLCAGLDLGTADLESHSSWVSATAKAIAQANPDARVYAGPFRLSQLKKGDLETLLGDVLEKNPGALTGVFVDVDTPIDDSELGGGDLETKFTNARTVLKLIGGESLELVVVGNHIPSVSYEAGHSWVRPCAAGGLCNEDIQGQILAKSLLRAQAKGHSIGVAAPIGFQGNEDTPGPLATVATSWVDDTPVVNASGMMWIRLAEELQKEGANVTELTAPVQNVRMVRVGSEDAEQTLIIWYDWYRESAPGQPYSGIQKSISIDAPDGAEQAVIVTLDADVDSSVVALPEEVHHGEASHVVIDAQRQFKVALEDRLIVVRYTTEIPVADDPPVEIVESADAGPVEEDTSGTSGSGGGCSNTGASHLPWPLVLTGLLSVLVLRRQTGAQS